MVRFTSLVLAAFAAALHVAVGFRSEHHPVWWHEHPASSAEKLQQSLRTILTDSTDVTTQAKSAEARGDAEAQERTLREQVAIIRKDWQSASASACHQQLGRLVNNLTLSCEDLQPKADWALNLYVLPNKTCAESVSDIFTLGNELVETLRVSRDAIASLALDDKTLRRYQALSFARSWLAKLTETRHHALLWAGFWDGDPENRTTLTKLSNFAKAIEHATVHPDSFLGQAIEASENLDACYEDAQTSALAANMWSIASMSFVLGMRDKAQGTVIALVNKQITGERNLSESVLSTHEIPTVGLAAWGLGFWSPKVLVVDLMGTLDEALAEHVEKLVKAKAEQDLKDQELCEVVLGYGLGSLWDLQKGFKRSKAGQRQLEVEQLLRQNADPKALNPRGGTALISAAAEGLQEVVEALVKAGAQLEARDRDGRTALLRASFKGHLKVVEALVKAGAQLEARDGTGNTALTAASWFGHLNVVEALVKAGAQREARDDIDYYGNTALMKTCLRRNAVCTFGEIGAGQLLVRAAWKVRLLPPKLTMKTGACGKAAQFTGARLIGRVRRPSRQFVAFCAPGKLSSEPGEAATGSVADVYPLVDTSVEIPGPAQRNPFRIHGT
ncbi:unnamed protein product [Symbiodinium sp. CCMP2456]|nr:unnamed protein product [Symbiodinium sp. CCMP2456]